MLAPDTAFPLTGYRYWRVRDGVLTALSGMLWTPGSVVEASCERCAEPPGLGCGCGLYASLTAPRVYPGEVWGTVEGWGRYVRHSAGWRTQFARVTGLASGLAERYAVPRCGESTLPRR